MTPHTINKENIWNFEQNKPTLIAKDLEPFGVPREVTHNVLLARGVYKWLAVRRDLIKLKNVWRDRLTECYHAAQANRNPIRGAYLKGYAKGVEQCRKEVRALFRSGRFRAPDFDKEANAYIASLD